MNKRVDSLPLTGTMEYDCDAAYYDRADQITAEGASEEVKEFIDIFLPLALRTFESRSARSISWVQADLTKNGRLSFSQIELWIRLTLERLKGTLYGKNLFFSFRPAYLLAFSHTTAVTAAAATSAKADVNRVIFPASLRLYVAHLCAYALMYDAFHKIKSNNNQERSRSICCGLRNNEINLEDRAYKQRISRDQWQTGYMLVSSYGLTALSNLAEENSKSAKDLFLKIDSNNSGIILFHQWCQYLKQEEIYNNTTLASLLSLGDCFLDCSENNLFKIIENSNVVPKRQHTPDLVQQNNDDDSYSDGPTVIDYDSYQDNSSVDIDDEITALNDVIEGIQEAIERAPFSELEGDQGEQGDRFLEKENQRMEKGHTNNNNRDTSHDNNTSKLLKKLDVGGKNKRDLSPLEEMKSLERKYETALWRINDLEMIVDVIKSELHFSNDFTGSIMSNEQIEVLDNKNQILYGGVNKEESTLFHTQCNCMEVDEKTMPCSSSHSSTAKESDYSDSEEDFMVLMPSFDTLSTLSPLSTPNVLELHDNSDKINNILKEESTIVTASKGRRSKFESQPSFFQYSREASDIVRLDSVGANLFQDRGGMSNSGEIKKVLREKEEIEKDEIISLACQMETTAILREEKMTNSINCMHHKDALAANQITAEKSIISESASLLQSREELETSLIEATKNESFPMNHDSFNVPILRMETDSSITTIESISSGTMHESREKMNIGIGASQPKSKGLHQDTFYSSFQVRDGESNVSAADFLSRNGFHETQRSVGLQKYHLRCLCFAWCFVCYFFWCRLMDSTETFSTEIQQSGFAVGVVTLLFFFWLALFIVPVLAVLLVTIFTEKDPILKDMAEVKIPCTEFGQIMNGFTKKGRRKHFSSCSLLLIGIILVLIAVKGGGQYNIYNVSGQNKTFENFSSSYVTKTYGIIWENDISHVISENVAIATLREVFTKKADQPFQTLPHKMTSNSSDIPRESANHAKTSVFRISKLKCLKGMKRMGLKMLFSLLPDILRKMSPDNMHATFKKVLR